MVPGLCPPPPPSPSCTLKDKREFQILPVKIFSLKQKTNQILPATIEKIKFCFFHQAHIHVLKTVNNSAPCRSGSFEQMDCTFVTNENWI